jgi:hypothetical protein
MDKDLQQNTPVVVPTADGLVHKGLVGNLLRPQDRPFDPTAILGKEPERWGGEGQFTSDQVKQLIIALVAEGTTIRGSVATLQEKYGRMPSSLEIHRWMSRDDSFDREYRLALKVRADLKVEAAQEVVLKAGTKDEVARAKLVASQLQWEAEKDDPKTFGKRVQVDQAPQSAESIDDLKAELRALLADKDTKDALKLELRQEVMDVEILLENDIASQAPLETPEAEEPMSPIDPPAYPLMTLQKSPIEAAREAHPKPEKARKTPAKKAPEATKAGSRRPKKG